MRRTWIWSVLLAFAAASAATTGRAGDENDKPVKKPVDGAQVIKGELTTDDMPIDKDRDKHPGKVHTAKFTKGTTYRIDLRSTDFDSYLRLESPDGKQLAADDDGGGFPNARIVHTAEADGDYRVIATSFDGKLGKYTLTIANASAQDALIAKVATLPKMTKAEQERFLTEIKKDLMARRDKLTIPDLKMMGQIAQGLEQAGNGTLAAEAYRDFGKILVGSSDANLVKGGKNFIDAASRAEMMAKLNTLPRMTEAEQKRFLIEVKKDVMARGDKLAIPDVQMMMRIAQGLERGGNGALASEAYHDFGKILSGSSEAKFADLGKLFTGAARRAKLMGNPITVHGQTLAGDNFDWSKYKGKVVLVDFWATWCGPCIGEIPNIKKMYKTYHKRGFEVVAISLDKDKDAPTEFMKDKKLPWVCLYDQEPGKGLDSLSQYYGVFAIPQAILVDRDGRVISMNARGDELERLLEKHIGPPTEEKKDKSGDSK